MFVRVIRDGWIFICVVFVVFIILVMESIDECVDDYFVFYYD